MRVLIACEESQEVCKAFRSLGHEAYSCDLQDCSGGHPEWHIKADALEMIKMTWDLIIAHPPCTYLSTAGALHLLNADHSIKDEERYRRGLEAKEFFMKIYNADCPRIAIENPAPIALFDLPKHHQIIEPYMFGDAWKKRTFLWLKNLPILFGTEVVVPQGCWVDVGHSAGNRTRYDRRTPLP